MIDKDLIKKVSTNPGVYFWKDKNQKIIYVGKAKNLKSRMSQYFDPNMRNSYKTPKMLDEVSSFETVVFQTEMEAIMFETNMINKYKPKYNVMLPTQATFPYICITKSDKKITIKLVNNYKKTKNSLYYGPLVKHSKYKLLMDYLRRILLYEKGLPIKNFSQQKLDETFEKAKKIIKFDKDFKNELIKKINYFSDIMDYSSAADYQEIHNYLYKEENKQNLQLKGKKDIDVFGIYEYKENLFITIMHYRSSFLISKTDFQFEIQTTTIDTFSNFIEDYYKKNQIPYSIILPFNFKNCFINEEINKRISKEIYLSKKLLAIANENAKNDIENKIKLIKSKNNINQTIKKMTKLLNADLSKFVIFDNSFIPRSKEVVGAAFVYHNGLILKDLKRAFILEKHFFGNSDNYYMEQNAWNFLKYYHEKIETIFVDGSIEQIKAIKKILNNLKIEKQIFGLVKNNKHTFSKIIDQNFQEITIEDEEIINFLTKIQFDVDKYAKKWYNKRHNKNLIISPLTNIKGIGQKTEEKLLDFFGSYEEILKSDLKTLTKFVSLDIATEILKIKI